jgi:integrase
VITLRPNSVVSLDKDNLGRLFGKLLDEPGSNAVVFYEARHTAATLLLVQGVHARAVMDLLGHSTYRLTMGAYTHFMPALQREAADSIECAFG